jgi:hypothetical protein
MPEHQLVVEDINDVSVSLPRQPELIVQPPTLRSRLRETLDRKFSRCLLVASLAMGAVATMEVAEAPSAAASVPHSVYRTGPDGLWLHAGPGIQTARITLMPDGAKFDATCWNISDDVNGDPAWLHGTYQSPEGPIEGDAADYYVDTVWNTTDDLVAQGIPGCGSESAPNLGNSTDNPQQARHLPCTPFLLIGARGSGEPYENDNNDAGSSGFSTTLGPISDALTFYYGRDRITSYGLPYPAAGLEPLSQLAQVFAGPYADSVRRGEELLVQLLNNQTNACPDQEFFLAGYSQGAEVIGNVLSRTDPTISARILGAVLFGDPQFNPTSEVDRGTFNHDYGGGIIAQRPEYPADMIDKIRSYCSSWDGICNVTPANVAALKLPSSPHSHYMDTEVGNGTMFLESKAPYDMSGRYYG